MDFNEIVPTYCQSSRLSSQKENQDFFQLISETYIFQFGFTSQVFWAPMPLSD